MSWQEYVKDDLVSTGAIEGAAIISAEDGAIWAQEALAISEEEATAISNHFHATKEPESTLQLSIANKPFVFTNFEIGRAAYGKRGLEGVICLKTQQTILVGYYEAHQQCSEALLALEKLSKFLQEQGF